LAREHLTFAEAGPRETLRFPVGWDTELEVLKLDVGIVVTGGIAPGINAVISGIVQRHLLYHSPDTGQVKRGANLHQYQLRILGYMNGFVDLPGATHTVLFSSHGMSGRMASVASARAEARKTSGDPGSRLGTSRQEKMLGSRDPAERTGAIDRIVERLKSDGIDILYVIGGDGSMRAAHAIWETAQRSGYPISVVAVPKTMDNDILWVWQSFGFLSAVEKAREALQQLHVEVTSNPRLCICQLFGSDSGFVVSHAALASGVCDLALIPEVPFSMDVIGRYVVQRLRDRYFASKSPYALVAMAETAIPTDVEKYIDDQEIGLDDGEKEHVRLFLAHGRRVEGQTPDELRRAGLKIVSRVLERKIHEVNTFDSFRVFSNEPRHLLRTTGPSVSDVIFGQRLGTLAVDNAMAGYTDFMISQWMTEYVLVPLPLVILGRKRVPPEGIFWKSVLASTGQPAKLDG
jgi:6-phosphofructokinase 1